MKNIRSSLLVFGVSLLVLTWSGLRVWSAKTMSQAMERERERAKESVEHLGGALDQMPSYQLTFLGADFLRAGDYELAKVALEMATKKDRFYRDAFRYYAYALEATGENDRAELAMRRAKTLDPRLDFGD